MEKGLFEVYSRMSVWDSSPAVDAHEIRELELVGPPFSFLTGITYVYTIYTIPAYYDKIYNFIHTSQWDPWKEHRILGIF